MLSFALGFLTGLVVAVLSPPVFRWVSAKIDQVKAWSTKKE